MERRIRRDPILRTPVGDFPLLPYTHVRDSSPPASRTSAMVLQLADALEQAGVASQPRTAAYSVLVERQAADGAGQ
eukprot:14490254-Alexandrium_andersonii.AAC.1